VSHDSLKVAENMQKVADIQRSFGRDAPVLVAPSRRFVNEAKGTTELRSAFAWGRGLQQFE
jgi:hypothetical protein